jgi:hypothetical protein
MRSLAALAFRHAVAFRPLPTTTTVSSLVSCKVFRPKISVSRLKSLENGVLFNNMTGRAAFSAPHPPSHHLAHLSTEPSYPRHQHRATGDHETAGASQQTAGASQQTAGAAAATAPPPPPPRRGHIQRITTSGCPPGHVARDCTEPCQEEAVRSRNH